MPNGTRGRTRTGTLLRAGDFESPVSTNFTTLVAPVNPRNRIQRFILMENFSALMVGRADDLFELKFNAPLLELLDKIGHMPLPPYIDRADSAEDKSRYQTVYADQ